ncbi:hypothetical protein OAZ93_00520 [Prochlorococcus sp. AH-736-F09]|nr:hypothetical protein [Prochlorococcus sp. AH-736-F09]
MFDYLFEKIYTSEFQKKPFNHIYIENFFQKDHFKQIINSKQINLTHFKSTKALCIGLLNNGFKPTNFPGCTTSIEQYLKWEKGSSRYFSNVNTTEGFGMVFRMQNSKDFIINQILEFINSKQLKQVLCNKFNIDFNDVYSEVGIQKYLNGYEISPHPDIKKKALTFMVNINPGIDSEKADFHTHYMSFIDSKKYIYDFWKYNQQFDRCWVPWEWCRTIKQQIKNNSIVIFQPSHKTLHAIKAKYNHLNTQRTQLYGNLWYEEKSKSYPISSSKIPQIPWEGLLIDDKFGKENIMHTSMDPIIKVRRKAKQIFNNLF